MPSGEKRTNGWIKGTQVKGRDKPNNAHGRTPARINLRNQFWIPIRDQLRAHLARCPQGEAGFISRQLHVHPSQVHRWSCDVCEHDAEPYFSVGMALKQYLDNYQHPVFSPSEAYQRHKFNLTKTL